MTTPPQPLAGLRVVELSSFVATPLSGLTLAHLGADVIRVEDLAGGPDRGRWPLAENGTSLYWSGLNGGKRAVAVDLSSAHGRDLIADLIAEVGIVVTNTDRYRGLTDADLRARRPDLIHVHLSGRHDGGTAVDYTVQATVGFPFITGPESSAAPVNHVLPAYDVMAGMYLATGLLAAERHRRQTGEGRHIQVALEDVALAAAGQLGYLAEAQLRAEGERRAEDNHVYGTFGRDFRAADGARYMIVALTPRQWSDLVDITGIGPAVDALQEALDADFADQGERYRHRTVLAALIEAWFDRHPSETVERSLAGTRVLWERYRHFEDWAADDAVLMREHPLFEPVEQPGVGTYLAPTSPLVLDGRRSPARPAPDVGQHTHDVFAEILRIDPERLSELTGAEIIAAPTDPTHP